eukprot:5343404-Lingulodinium_polyedra.AAC.1
MQQVVLAAARACGTVGSQNSGVKSVNWATSRKMAAARRAPRNRVWALPAAAIAMNGAGPPW